MEQAGDVIPGSQIQDCTDCQRPVVYAPSSIPVLEAGGILVCVECAFERAQAEDADGVEVRVCEVSEAQVQELNSYFDEHKTAAEWSQELAEKASAFMRYKDE